MVLSNGVTEYLKKDYKIFGDFFATCKKNYHGSYDLVRILKITSENTLEEERGESTRETIKYLLTRPRRNPYLV